MHSSNSYWGQDGQKGNYLEIENWLNINVNIDTFRGFGLFGGTSAILPPFWTEMYDPMTILQAHM